MHIIGKLYRVEKCHAPFFFFVLNLMHFPSKTYSFKRGQTFIYILNTITGPCLKIYHSWYINFPRHVFILHTAMPITCYIQFLSLSVLEKYVNHLFQSVYTISLHTRKLALMANNNVQHYNGVSAFTMYICTISYFPVHLKLDF